MQCNQNPLSALLSCYTCKGLLDFICFEQFNKNILQLSSQTWCTSTKTILKATFIIKNVGEALVLLHFNTNLPVVFSNEFFLFHYVNKLWI